jgi:outer membrane receptor protein involved in Fe transport
MKNYLLHFSLFSLLLIAFTASAQQVTISGEVKDPTSSEPLVGASVIIKGTENGAATDKQGKFSISTTKSDSYKIVASYLGYLQREIEITDATVFVSISLESTSIPGQEVVISASRVEENIMKSPSAIYKINAASIQSSASGDFYEDLDNITGVDVITNGVGFKVFNARGFNTTAPFRVVQFIDGMDNTSPGLNFAPGNSFSVSDLDIESVEVISGPASAMYGPNALQGVLSINTKSPFDHEGVA